MTFVGKWFGFGRNPHYDDGIRAYERGDFVRAVECFRICLASDPDPGTRQRARNYLAGSLGKLGAGSTDPAEAVRLLSEAVAVRPEYADLHLALARALRQIGDHDGEARAVEAALAINPRYALALLHRAALGNDPADIDAAVAADARLGGLGLVAARTAFAAGDPEPLLALRPLAATDANDLARHADKLMRSRNWSGAEEQYRRAIELAPRYADLHCRRGQALFELGELDRAAEEFQEAAAINPRYAEANALLGVTFRRMGREEEALAAFRAALEVDPEHVVAREELMRRRV